MMNLNVLLKQLQEIMKTVALVRDEAVNDAIAAKCKQIHEWLEVHPEVTPDDFQGLEPKFCQAMVLAMINATAFAEITGEL